jgi:hypothetical protein
VSPAAVAVRAVATARAPGGVRRFERADVPAIARLWARCFPLDAARSDLQTRLATVLLDHPWVDPALSSLVYEDARGLPVGFLGVIPRPMVLDGAPLRVAVSTRFMVDPAHRGAAALRLLQTFLRGPQDLSLADVASAASRALWERLGGMVAGNYGLQWSRPLAPARAALAELGLRTGSRTAAVLSRSLGRLADVALAPLARGVQGRRPCRFTGEAVSAPELLDCLDAHGAGYALRPRYTAATLAWLLGVVETRLSPLHCVRVLHGDAVIGGYVYGFAGHVGKVLRLWAARGRFGDVMEQLLADASAHDAAMVTGRLEPHAIPEMDAGLYVVCRGPWVLAHSRHGRVLDVIARGDAVLSRMEGEWWAAP